jgi:hypothetical protein
MPIATTLGTAHPEEMPMRGRPVVTAVIAAMVMLQLAGCGDAAPNGGATSEQSSTATVSPTPTGNGLELMSADEILARSIAALEAAPSYRMEVTARLALFTTEMDVVYVGSDAKGSQSAMGESVEFVRVGKYLYVKGTAGYWSTKVSLSQVSSFSGKWVKVDATNEAHGGVVPSIDRYVSSDVTKTGSGTIDGQPVVILSNTGGDSIHIITQGEPYPLRVEGVESTDTGEVRVVIDLSDFGEVTETIAPPSGEIIDISTA